ALELDLLDVAVGLGQLVVVGLLVAQLLGLLDVGVLAAPAGPLDHRAGTALLLAVDVVVLLVPVDPPLRGLHVGELVGLVLRVARDAGDVEADRRATHVAPAHARPHLDAAQHVDADPAVAELLDEGAVAVAPPEEQELHVLALHVPGRFDHAGRRHGRVPGRDAVGQLPGAGGALLAGLRVEVGLPLLLAPLGHRVLAATDLHARRRVLVDLLAGRQRVGARLVVRVLLRPAPTVPDAVDVLLQVLGPVGAVLEPVRPLLVARRRHGVPEAADLHDGRVLGLVGAVDVVERDVLVAVTGGRAVVSPAAPTTAAASAARVLAAALLPRLLDDRVDGAQPLLAHRRADRRRGGEHDADHEQQHADDRDVLRQRLPRLAIPSGHDRHARSGR